MKSTLPDGALIKFRDRGKDAIYEVVGAPGTEQGYTGVRDGVKRGTIMHQCVWKGDRLEVRRAYPLKKDLVYTPLKGPVRPDGIYRLAESSMFSMAAGLLGAANLGDVLSAFGITAVYKGHEFVLSECGIACAMPGASWHWSEPDPKHRGMYQPVRAPKNAGRLSDATLMRLASKAYRAMHSRSGLKFTPMCFVCKPVLQVSEG